MTTVTIRADFKSSTYPKGVTGLTPTVYIDKLDGTAGEVNDQGYKDNGVQYATLGHAGTSLVRLWAEDGYWSINSSNHNITMNYTEIMSGNNSGSKYIVAYNSRNVSGILGPWIIEELGGEDCEIYGVGNLEEEITCDTAHINSEASITLNSDGIINFNRIVKEPDATLILDGGFFRRR